MTRTIAIFGLGLLLAVGAGRPAGAAWEVNGAGECVRTWTPASLGRGPSALVNAPPLMFRAGAGGVQHAGDFWKTAPVPIGVLTVPGMVWLAGMGGLGESLIWILGGVADTVTGGFFEIAPDAATEFSLAPVQPFFIPAAPVTRTQDRCGRPLRQ